MQVVVDRGLLLWYVKGTCGSPAQRLFELWIGGVLIWSSRWLWQWPMPVSKMWHLKIKLYKLFWIWDYDLIIIRGMASKAAMVEVAYQIFDTYDENNSGFL